LVLDLRIAHDRVGSSTDPTLNGHLKYPNNLDQSLNDATAEKIRKYRADYNNRPPSAVSFMPAIASTLSQADYMVNLSDFYSYRLIGKLTDFLQLQEFSQRHFRCAAFVQQLKSRVDLALAKATALRINLNLDFQFHDRPSV
jgi:hypothetical protein